MRQLLSYIVSRLTRFRNAVIYCCKILTAVLKGGAPSLPNHTSDAGSEGPPQSAKHWYYGASPGSPYLNLISIGASYAQRTLSLWSKASEGRA